MSPPNLLALVSRVCASVSGALCAIGLAFAAVGRTTRKPIRRVLITHPEQEVVFGAAAGIVSSAKVSRATGMCGRSSQQASAWRNCPRCDLPEFAAWEGYAAVHVQNAKRVHLRMEQDSFND